MNFVLAQITVKTPGGTEVGWDFLDWLGLSVVILVVAFVAVTLWAQAQGVPPLKLLDRLGHLIALGFKRRP